VLHRFDQALPHAGDLLPACFELLSEIGAGLTSPTTARLRFGQMKFATSRPALLPSANQVHLDRPMPAVTAGDWPCGENSTQPGARVTREMALAMQRACGFRNLATLIAGHPGARSKGRSDACSEIGQQLQRPKWHASRGRTLPLMYKCIFLMIRREPQ